MLRAMLILMACLPANAFATCLVQCDVKLVNLSCAVQPDGSAIPAAGPLLFAATCQDCCSPPGGPVTCNPTDASQVNWKALDDANQPVAGGFSDLKQKCTDGEMFGFAPTGNLPSGKYQLLQDNLILAHFEVAPPATNCAKDADCGTCAVCISGNCMGMGLIECMVDTDCASGQTCHKGAQSCQNQCVAKSGCTSNADCAKCEDCIGGQCKGNDYFICKYDSDCNPGQFCQIGACSNLCVAMATDAGPQDVAQSDAVQTETIAADMATIDVVPDSATDSPSDSSSSDSTCLTCDAGSAGSAQSDVADASGSEVGAADSGPAASGGGAPSKSGCAATRTADGAWAGLLALAGLVIVRRRQAA